MLLLSSSSRKVTGEWLFPCKFTLVCLSL
jgi:hypothetical protein